MRTCLNLAIVLWSVKPDLEGMGNLRSGGAIVRDSGRASVITDSNPRSITTKQPEVWLGRSHRQTTSRPGMHDALLVDEILRRIAKYLFDSSNKSSSLAFALCCRSLTDPVLDILWEWQTDLVTLFKVLPPDLWEESGTVGLVSTGLRTLVD